MADPITWYTQSRTIDDDQSILEAIDAKLLTHNQDPSSHGQAGEVVEEHRSEPELDHVFGSISLKHLLRDRYVIFTCFDSLDGWAGTRQESVNIFNSFIYTTTVLGNIATCEAWDKLFGDIVDFSKNPFFQTTLYTKDASDQQMYFGSGRYRINPTDDSFGFKILEAKLYAWWTSNLVQFTSEIAGITITERNVYRAEVRSADEEIDFYVNGVLKYTATANFPIIPNYYPAFYWINNLVAATRGMNIVDLLFEVER